MDYYLKDLKNITKIDKYKKAKKAFLHLLHEIVVGVIVVDDDIKEIHIENAKYLKDNDMLLLNHYVNNLIEIVEKRTKNIDLELDLYEKEKYGINTISELKTKYSVTTNSNNIISNKKNNYEFKNLKPLKLLENTEENEKLNDILNIYHDISLPHKIKDKNLINLKYIGILNSIFNGIGEAEFKELNIMFNPKIGLLIQSEEGINNPNQILIMSHADLVPSFEKIHTEIYEGKRETALNIDDNGLISGSLDNTITNAVVIDNFIKRKLGNNVSILFEVDEETSMNGSKGFFQKDFFYSWYKLDYINDDYNFELINMYEIEKSDEQINKIKEDIKRHHILFDNSIEYFNIEKDSNLYIEFQNKYIQKISSLKNEIENFKNVLSNNEHHILINLPYYKDDLFVINMDVAMGYDKSFAIEIKNFDNKTLLKDTFDKGNISKYNEDDSLLTVPKKLESFSYCINVGDKVSETNKGFAFDGNCHSMNTTTSQKNIISYSKNLEKLINFVNINRKNISIEKEQASFELK